MKCRLFVLCVVMMVSHGFAQQPFSEMAGLGIFQVGYADSVVYDHEIRYNQYGYEGPAPIFVQIWFPIESHCARPKLRLGDLRRCTLPKNLTEVYSALTAHMDERYALDCLSYDISNGDEINYGDTSVPDVLNQIMAMESWSIPATLAGKLEYPALVFHHGSTGMSDENLVMAEYFASRGYIFVSANFHLPFPDMPFGLLPYALEQENRHNQSTARRVVEFAKSLTNNPNLFFIGHSWGAQEGWCFLDATWVRGFVSLETTIEYKTDSLEIKDMWPYLYNALAIKKRNLGIPALVIASEDEGLNFDFFKDRSGVGTTYASYKMPFAHNSYTSAYLVRYFLGDTFAKPDAAALRTQVEGYAAHLKLMEAWLESVQMGVGFDGAPFERDFGLR